MAKRSLMLAGGGLKIPFQAGVLQVWLDEAGIEFDHGDGVRAAGFIISRDDELLHPRALGTAAREGDLDAQASKPTVH